MHDNNGKPKTQKGGSYMPDIIMFEKPKQLYALGLVDKYDRIAACFVDPSTTHPEPEIVAVPLTQLGLLHVGIATKRCVTA